MNLTIIISQYTQNNLQNSTWVFYGLARRRIEKLTHKEQMGRLWNTVTQYVKLYFGFGLQPVFKRPGVDQHWSAALV